MRKSVLFGLIGVLASLVPAFAGEVYVPYASNRNVNGTTYRTRVWVTNTGAAGRQFSVRFLAQDTDGTQAGAPNTLNVPSGGTVVLTNIAPAGQSGILEIDGAPQLVVNARLEAVSPNSAVLANAHVPVVAVDNVIAPNHTAHIQGLERSPGGVLTDFGILNLNRTASQCSLKAYRANGTQIAQTAIVTVKPLSLRYFDESLASLGETSIADARLEVSCDKQFFPFASVYRAGGPELSFTVPSHSLAGDLVAGGGNPAGSVVFEVPGTFLAARNGDSFKQYDLPLVNGVQYKKATVEFDLYVNRFPNGIFAGVTALRRNDRTLFFGMMVRGGRQKTILDMGVDDDVVFGNNGGPWRERTNYHLVFEYDTDTRKLTFRCFRNGALVETLTGDINHFDLSLNSRVMRVDFGQTGVADGAYFPPIGWIYSNLRVVFEPE
ncbi:MAG TPA: hypothetical protein VF756_00300 [Thermoanaerobaculia bacterium]